VKEGSRAKERAALAASPFVSLSGFAGLAVLVALGFEEANTILLVSSAVALVAPLVVALLHLFLTRELNRAEKRLWLRELFGRRASGAWPEYLRCRDRAGAARAFAAAKPDTESSSISF
jgi:hypothetical protein